MDSHYNSLLAEWYDELLWNEGKDIEFYTSVIKKENEPVLELACGTGRILIELLKNGVQCDGLDLSHDMLNICRDKLEKNKLTTDLYEQNIIDFEIDKKYKTIFVPGGSFQLVSDFDEALLSIETIYNHLIDGGKFIIDLFLPYNDIAKNNDGVWKLMRTAERGDEKFIANGSTKYDYLNQLINGEYRYELYKNGGLVKTVNDSLSLRWYGVNEFVLILEGIGFSNVSIDTKNIISSHGNSIVIFAEK
ncbi:MAG: class I SAM-dependent methyltransferase [Melioribacteraceae bacterium]|nr:class I SAM-dependent methyltransferase [Melioribacteraceae bacterium]MCF8356740.1 class I SAM-dependent methyltransferase [Melioribacteraceae bacterium]MCF8395963.1 class I SAM-dependent methyltransferase [Melioribacteraceae bacterium]MCF8419526.1 class I SAM-dependent methyltransferase [Melioribacteraceae bacterium]